MYWECEHKPSGQIRPTTLKTITISKACYCERNVLGRHSTLKFVIHTLKPLLKNNSVHKPSLVQHNFDDESCNLIQFTAVMIVPDSRVEMPHSPNGFMRLGTMAASIKFRN